ncbi:hypothetical protein [Streptomyces sp. CAU 1734]|uniref:hypothetical protein n=1 Tax=Streptomyces sp. CAU 1734 TaxID=3140360 RepID=UPI003260D474
MNDDEPTRCGVCLSEVAPRKDGTIRRHGACEGAGRRPLMTQYGVRWIPAGPVFAYGSRSEAVREMEARGRGALVFQQGIPGTPEAQWTPWAPVDTGIPVRER